MAEKSERAQKEEKILQFWKDNQIFEKTLEKKAPKGDFIFYEGPPTANAKPALHHLASRVFKDAIPRYKTMQGFHVPRKAGWDTHGLPVELQIEKKLGLKSKKEIETYGVEKFNHECRESVFEYIGDWEQFTERIGYWVNFKDAYYTFKNSYIETLWSILAHVDKRNLLYKDYKVLPWCPRCGTALSSHELAQGYQDIKDISLYTKFKVLEQENTYFLAWTTTPWTLPGNVALAVGKDVKYSFVKDTDGNTYIIASDLVNKLFSEKAQAIVIQKEMTGRELVGLSYEPLYDYLKDSILAFNLPGGKKAFKVYTADFVNTSDGTGIVHTAVMYGQDDFELGKSIGLPKYHLVLEDGHYKVVQKLQNDEKSNMKFLSEKSVVEEATAIEILKDLQDRGLLFKKESYTHSYPFCWRCKTRLIYYARDSWYIAMSKLRDELVDENKKIHWEPEHIKEGRFGEWLREIKDWAISRERYWGTPLPVWENKDKSKRIVVDSLETLKKYAKKSSNRYFVMRHGRAQNNELNILNSDPARELHLTEDGKEAVKNSTQEFKEKIDLIFVSPFLRTKETAEIVRESLDLPKEAVIEDKRLSEMNFGEFDGKSVEDYHKLYPNTTQEFDKHPSGGENERDVKRRVGEFLYEIEKKHSGKNIMIVSHGDPIWMLESVTQGANTPAMLWIAQEHYPKYAEIRELSFTPLPHNGEFELDLHRPYIDEIVLEKDGEEYRRTKEVMDVWFDSGAMPFAQDPEHVLYPADFISEAIDQTRGWFYTLHAIGILMEKGRAFKNVICLGHILDKEGKKMSKSIGNIVNPWEMMDKYGVDALRLWMYSINQPGESKNFDERTVDEIQKRVFNLLDNVYSFYELYRDKNLENNDKPKSDNVLDKWILRRLSELTVTMTEKIDAYKLLEPVRAYKEFVDDFSTWYLRRSRDRIKDGDKETKATLYHVLKELSKLIAPFAPFYAENLYQKLRIESDSLSVHLEAWPEENKSFFKKLMPGKSESLIEDMKKAREIVSLALEARSKTNIKVRQPLKKLEIKAELPKEYLEIIKDELNVKEVLINNAIQSEVLLDINLTPELIEEGKMRDSLRVVQEWRKEQGLKPGEKATYQIPAGEEELFRKFAEEIKKAANVDF
jgi:isoleucyl-tRNA synthetase